MLTLTIDVQLVNLFTSIVFLYALDKVVILAVLLVREKLRYSSFDIVS